LEAGRGVDSHDLPEPVWRPVVEALTENFAAAQTSDCDPVHTDSDHQPGL
jgi:hypothetical protein